MDTSAFNRDEILDKLGQVSSPQQTDKLKSLLQNILMKNHPIYTYLSQLTSTDLKKGSQIILEKQGNYQYARIRKALTKEMFKKFPKAPLTTLIGIRLKGHYHASHMDFIHGIPNTTQGGVE